MPDDSLPADSVSNGNNSFGSKPFDSGINQTVESSEPLPAFSPKPHVPTSSDARIATAPVIASVDWEGRVRKLFLMILAGLVFLGGGGIGGWFLHDMLGRPKPETAQNAPVVPSDTSPILIGGIFPLTGDAASYGIPYQKAAQLAQKEINMAGGIAGRPIEMIWEDGRCEGPSAKVAAEKLVNEKKADFLIGGACSSEFLVSAPIAQSKQVLSFSPSATSPEISKLGRFVFRTSPSDALAGKVAAEYAFTKFDAKTAAIIVENNEYGLGLAGVFEEEFSLMGGKVVYNQPYDSGVTDFSTIVNEIKQLNPDVVYVVPQSSTPGVLLISALKGAKISSKFLTAEVLLQRDIVEKQGKVLDGVTGVELFFDEKRPQTNKFFEAYKAEYGLDVVDPAYMAATYDIIYLIKAAYEAANGDHNAMADYIYSLKNWEAAVGDLSFDRHGDPTFSYSIRKMIGGEALLIEVYTPKL